MRGRVADRDWGLVFLFIGVHFATPYSPNRGGAAGLDPNDRLAAGGGREATQRQPTQTAKSQPTDTSPQVNANILALPRWAVTLITTISFSTITIRMYGTYTRKTANWVALTFLRRYCYISLVTGRSQSDNQPAENVTLTPDGRW